MPQPACHLGEDPPVRSRLPRGRREGPLAGDAPLRVGDGPVLFPPARRREQDVRAGGGIRVRGQVRDYDQFAGPQGGTHPVGIG